MQRRVTLYSTPSCPYCKMTREFFLKHAIAYIDVDVTDNEGQAAQMIEKSGQMGVPVIDIDGQIISGYNKQALTKALGVKE